MCEGAFWIWSAKGNTETIATISCDTQCFDYMTARHNDFEAALGVVAKVDVSAALGVHASIPWRGKQVSAAAATLHHRPRASSDWRGHSLHL